MSNNINIQPMYKLLTDSYDPAYVSRILDRIILNYLFSILNDTDGIVCKEELLEEFNLLVQLRDKTGACMLN